MVARVRGSTTRSTERECLTGTSQRLRNSTGEHLGKRSPEKPSVAAQRQEDRTLPRVGRTSSVTVQLAAGRTFRVVQVLARLTAARLSNEKAPADSNGQKPGSALIKTLSEATNEEVRRGNPAIGAVKACHLHAPEVEAG
ncbi:MAG: hypothetical protein WBI57_09600 [Desulfobacterales bacterium]